MHVFIFRHAHKSSSPWDNPPLSQHGMQQATQLAEKILQLKSLPTPNALLCSPKLRTQQTFAPIAKSLNINLQVRDHLDERRQNESSAQFSSRVQTILNQLENTETPEKTYYLCSHLDWIEDALVHIPSSDDLLKLAEWSPLGFAGFKITRGLWKLIDHHPGVRV